MNNCNIIITGQIGSGKTTLAKRLLNSCPRALVLDPNGDDYGESYGYTTENITEAIDAFVESRHGPMKLIFQGEQPEHHNVLLQLAEKIQREKPTRAPLAIFYEEATTYSTLYDGMPQMLKLFRRGRRWRINGVSVVQRDTEISPTVRACTQLWVSTHQMKLSTDYKTLFDEKQVRALETFTPLTRIEQGRHFLTAPDYIDLFETWKAINR